MQWATATGRPFLHGRRASAVLATCDARGSRSPLTRRATDFTLPVSGGCRHVAVVDVILVIRPELADLPRHYTEAGVSDVAEKVAHRARDGFGFTGGVVATNPFGGRRATMTVHRCSAGNK